MNVSCNCCGEHKNAWGQAKVKLVKQAKTVSRWLRLKRSKWWLKQAGREEEGYS